MTFWVAGAVVGSSVIGGMAAGDAAGAQADASNRATEQTQKQFEQNREDQLPWMNRGNAAGDKLQYLMGLGKTPSVTSTSSGTQAPLTANDLFDTSGIDWKPNADLYANDPTYKRAYDQFIVDHQAAFKVAPGNGRGSDVNNATQQLSAYGFNLDAANQARDQRAQQDLATSQSDPQYGSLLRKFSMADFQADPGYQFRLDEGERGISRSAAARGGLFSGGTLKALSRFNQDTASAEYGNAYNRYNTDNSNIYNRLAGIAGTGQTATSTIGSQGLAASGMIGQSMQNAGEARASGYIGQSNAIGGGLSRLANGYQQGQYGSDNYNNRLDYSQQAGYAANTGYDPYQSSVSGGFEPMGL